MKLIPSTTDLLADKHYVGLPTALQDLVNQRLAAMREIASADNKERAMIVIAERYKNARGWGRGTLRNLFFLLKRTRDWRALLDKARAGSCYWGNLTDAALPLEFRQWLGTQWSHRQRGKFRAVYTDLARSYPKWRKGDETLAVPGYDRCPEPRVDTCLPDGWSYSNLQRLARQHASRAARKLINIGPKAAHAGFAYQPPTTRVGLEPGQYFLFDDCWNDFRVLYRGKGSRILTLHALDLASACNVLRGHKPTTEDERATEERLKEREMVFLVASLLSNIGYRPDGTFFVCEKATATIRPAEQTLLDQLTGGAIKVQTGPAGGGPGVAGLFAGRGGGNPRWKAPIESFFNLLHNRCDNMIEFPGQTGRNSRLDKPEGLELMERMDEQLFKAMQVLTPERQKLIRFNLLQYRDAAPAIDARVEFCNTRRDHDLEGWLDCGHKVPAFRLHRAMDFLPWTMLDRLSPDQQEQVRLMLAADPLLTGEVTLSPREVFDAGSARLRRFSPAQTALLLARVGGDERPVKRGLIEVNCPCVNPQEPLAFGPTIRDFQGNEEPLPEDEKFSAVVNDYDPRVVWLYDAKGGFKGVARRRAAAGTRGDATALQRHFKAKAAQVAAITGEARQLAAPITQRAAAILENNAALFKEQVAEITAPARALDKRAAREPDDFTALQNGKDKHAAAPVGHAASMQELNEL